MRPPHGHHDPQARKNRHRIAIPKTVRLIRVSGRARPHAFTRRHRFVEPEIKSVDARPVWSLVRAPSVTPDSEIVVRLRPVRDRQRTGQLPRHLRPNVGFEQLLRDHFHPAPPPAIQPQPAEPRKIAWTRHHAEIIAGPEKRAVFKFQPTEPLPKRLRQGLPENLLQRAGIELNRKIIVAPGGPRCLGTRIAARHIGQLTKRHRRILRPQCPARRLDGRIDTGQPARLHRREEQRAQDRLRRRRPPPVRRHFAP